MHNYDSSILVVSRCLWIALIFNISGQKTNFSSHFDEIISKILYSCVVFEFQRFCESYDGIGVDVRNSFNSPLLGISAREICRSDDYFFADNPIKRLVTRHSIQSYACSAFFGGDEEICPSDGSLDAMHFKFAIIHTDYFVSKYWQVWTILAAVHGDSQF